jgi:hypothetical protein
MYNLWLISFEYLQKHLGMEATYFQPRGSLSIYQEMGKDFGVELPWLRLVQLPEYNLPHMRVACRFEGHYKWNLFVDWMTKPYHAGIRGMYWLSASYREPELPDSPDEASNLVELMEEKGIGGNFSIRADVDGWISLVRQIIEIEEENMTG